jgi:probable HAF family extracellular repeat protein
MVVLAGARGLAQDVTGTFVPIEVPGAQSTAARAITADGRIVGQFTDTNGRTHGFLLADGSFTTIDVPGARSTFANGINSRGDIVGSWVDSAGVQHGFLLPAYGSFTVVDYPDSGTIFTAAFGINAAGDIVGFYHTVENSAACVLVATATKRCGFLLSRAGAYTSIDLPGARGPAPLGTSANWVDQRGDIVGAYFDGAIHGYLLSDGTVTQLDVPFSGGINTQARGINSQGDIVGSYALGSRFLSFRRDRHGNYDSLEAPTAAPAAATVAFGINAAGDIVGQYTYLGVTRGFVMYRMRTP